VNSSTLNKAQLAELARLLERREAELVAAAESLRAAIASPAEGVGQEVHDRVEDGDARMQSALELTQLGRQEGELQEVRAALRRLHDGQYGQCEECDQPIPFARLQVRPEARLCITHEEAWERAQQHNR
jgi:DnaK suppressor protein